MRWRRIETQGEGYNQEHSHPRMRGPIARSVGISSVMVAALLAIAGCGSSSNSGPVTLGVATAFTGTSGYDGAIFGAAVQIGCAQINQSGGVLGHRCAVSDINTLGDAADGALALRKAFATDKNLVAVYGLASGEATTEIPIVVANHAVAFSIAGDQSLFNNAKLAPSLYMDEPPDSQVGVSLGLAAVKDGCHRPALVFQSGPSAAPAAAGTVAALRDLGVKPVVNISLPGGLASYASTTAAIVGARADCLVDEIDDPASAGTFFGNLATALGGQYNMKTIGDDVSTNGPWVKAVVNVIGPQAVTAHFQVVQVATGANTPGARLVAKEWPGYHTGQPLTAGFVNPIYDSAILAALAMDEANSINPVQWRGYVAKIAAGVPGAVTVYTYGKGKKEIAAGHRVHYVGAIGSMHWDAQHSQTLPQASYGMLANGNLSATPILQISAAAIARASSGVSIP